jgi:hypothetical protein
MMRPGGGSCAFRSLSWSGQIFWAVGVIVCVVLLVRTVRLALTRSRLRLDRKLASLESATLFANQTHGCPLAEFHVGAVGLLRSDEGEDGTDTHCLELHFGPQRVEAFMAYDEAELSHVRARLVDWLGTNAHLGHSTNEDQRAAQETAENRT